MAVLIFDDVGSSLMNHQEAKPFLPIRSRSVLPVPPNKAMQTDGRFAAVADRQGVGLLIIMSKAETVSTADGWSRSAWVIFAIIFVLGLLLQLLRTTHGSGHWDSPLLASALLINALTHVLQLKGLAKQISQGVCWVIVVIAVIMLIISIARSGF